MKVVFNILGVVSFCFFLLKLFIHFFLDNKSGYGFKFSFFSGIQYFLSYDKKVAPELILWKKRCNYLYKIFLLTFVTCLILATFYFTLVGVP